MYIATSMVILVVFIIAVVAIIIALNRRRRLEATSDEPNRKVDFQIIFMVTLSVILLLTIICGTWQIWQLNKTLKSIDVKLADGDNTISGVNNTLSGINVILADIDKNLNSIFQIMPTR
jgi:multisubunit Na+/H+ antiporter MnhB subunit